MNSSGLMSVRKHMLLFEELQIKGRSSEDHAAFNRWMDDGRKRGMTVVQSREYAVGKMREQSGPGPMARAKLKSH